jgi:hypothetical protein
MLNISAKIIDFKLSSEDMIYNHCLIAVKFQNTLNYSPITDKYPPFTDFLFTLVPKQYSFAM